MSWKTLGGQKKFMRDAERFHKERFGHVDRKKAEQPPVVDDGEVADYLRPLLEQET